MDQQVFETLETDSCASLVHCVFRRGATWFALPAVAVREVLSRPDMVNVPKTPSTFVGLCHVRSEFIPVVNLDFVADDSAKSEDRMMLILEDDDGAWGILVAEVSKLRVLETSDAPESNHDGTEAAVIGWATVDETLIHVLELSRVRNIAERELASFRRPSACDIAEPEFGQDHQHAAVQA